MDGEALTKRFPIFRVCRVFPHAVSIQMPISRNADRFLLILYLDFWMKRFNNVIHFLGNC